MSATHSTRFTTSVTTSAPSRWRWKPAPLSALAGKYCRVRTTGMKASQRTMVTAPSNSSPRMGRNSGANATIATATTEA